MRWCRAVVGLSASIYGPMAAQLNSMGDRVGPNNMGLSNRLWQLSADMKTWALELSQAHAEAHTHPNG